MKTFLFVALMVLGVIAFFELSIQKTEEGRLVLFYTYKRKRGYIILVKV